MKIKFFLWLLLLPIMGYCQYYVGHELAYPISEFVNNSGSFRIKGKITADGSTYIYYGSNLKKFTAAGTPSNDFGNNGVVNNILPLHDFSSAMALSNQYIYLGTYNKIAKYDLGGTPDLSFGVNGVLTFSSGGVYNLFVSPDSSLFVELDNKIVKLSSDGQIDNSFSVINYLGASGGWKVDVSENNIYMFIENTSVGSNPYSYSIAKYDFNGIKDTQYGNGGSLQVFNSQVILDRASGDLYAQVSPSFPTSTDGNITRYTSAGLLDNTFGIGGTAIGDFPLKINRVISDSNNNILFFGGIIAYGYNKTVIFRLKHNGEADNTFNNGSYKYVSAGGDSGIADARLMDDNTYVCIDNLKGTQFTATTRTNKYIRTLDSSAIKLLSIQDTNGTKANDLQVYPNPASDFIKIEAGRNDKVSKINIYAITGELVLTASKSEIDIKHLATGSYLIEVIINNNIYKNKFIKK